MTVSKKNLMILLLFLVLTQFFGETKKNLVNYQILNERFLIARSQKHLVSVRSLIDEIEESIRSRSENDQLLNLRVLLAECYFEYGQLLLDGKEKERFFNTALQIVEDVFKDDLGNGRANYVAALASAALIDFVGVFEKLTLMNNFDVYIERALKNLQDDTYRGMAYMARGIRYMNPPWPFNDYKKAEESFREAEKYIPNYSGLYLYWAQLYLKLGNRKKGEELLRKVIEMGAHPLFEKQHEENVKTAKQILGVSK
jgi:tetratricopeptide (TPR) repeat protein